MHNFKELKVWQKAMDLSIEIYKSTMNFPPEERYGLISQLRRCSISIPSNIAEGSGRKTGKDFSMFLSHALASAYELETQIIISSSLKIISDNTSDLILCMTSEVQKMIIGLQRTLTEKK